MMPRKNVIIRCSMELYQTYKLLRFISDNIRNHGHSELAGLRPEYERQSGLSAQIVGDLWDGIVEQKFAEATSDGVHIRYAGRQLLEGKIGPVSWGLFAAEMRDHNVLAAAIGGAIGALAVLFIQWVIK